MGKIRTGKGTLTLIVLLLAGGIAGSALGHVLASYMPMLDNFTSIGIDHTTLDLYFLQLSFGLTMTLGPVTALGLFLGFLTYRKL
ncbi:hypothetical protein JCM14036_13080 [Desulfotomaculum defluvii]